MRSRADLNDDALGFELPDGWAELQPVIKASDIELYQLAINFIVIGRIIVRSEYVRSSVSMGMKGVLTVIQWDQLLSYLLCALAHVVDLSVQRMRELHKPLKHKFRKEGDRRSFPAYLLDAAVLQYDTCWPLQGYTSTHGTSHVSDTISGGIIYRVHFTKDELKLPLNCVVDGFKGASVLRVGRAAAAARVGPTAAGAALFLVRRHRHAHATCCFFSRALSRARNF